jgi:cobalt-zinc-cadmium efflux system outer membrane protein
MPLQLHDRNQGNVQRAQARHQESLVRQTLNEAQIRQSLYEIRLSLKNNVRQAGLLVDELMPVAGDLLKETQAGYQHGQYGVLKWMDAQDALFDVQRELIEARLAAFLQMLELERLTGQAMSEMTQDSATGGKK